MSNLNLGLSVNDVVSVNVLLSPIAAAERNFGSLLILGDSGVIDTQTRYRLYTNITGVAGDFGTTAPEYLAAAIFFGQSPQPAQLYIGSWARVATAGTLIGGIASSSLATYTALTAGAITLTINGSTNAYTGINLSSATSLAQVASLVQTAIGGGTLVTVAWNPSTSNWTFTSNTTGPTSSVLYVSATLQMSLNPGAGGYSVAGISAEAPATCVSIFTALSNSWYGVMFAASVMPSDAASLLVANLIQATTVSRIYGTTSQEGAALVTGDSTSLPFQLSQGNYTRTFCQYSSSSPYACAAIFGLAFTVNFNGVNTLYTLKFKQETSIVAETLTESQAAQLNTTNCNVFVNYNNSTAILQQGTMASGQFFDVIHGTDWLQNAVQTAVYNLLYTSGTKIPQTDQGVGQIVATITTELNQAVVNDLIAPGVWEGPAIGAIVTGQTLVKGYYVYAPPVATQSAAARAARQSPVITCAIKLAGAIHSVPVIINVSN